MAENQPAQSTDVSTAATGAQPLSSPLSTQAAPAPAAAAPSAETASATKPNGAPPSTPPAAEAAAPPQPGPVDYNLPKVLKLPGEAKTQLDEFLKAHVVDGKLTISAQDLVDHYGAQAVAAKTRWDAEQAENQKTMRAESERLYSKEQLAAAKIGGEFFADHDPAFAEFVRPFENHPTFVNMMRVVGQSLAEDTFVGTAQARPAPVKRTPAEILYGGKPTN